MVEIDTTPSEASSTWARLGDGLTTAAEANSETIDNTSYLDDDGFASSDVTGIQSQLDFSGHRVIGDAAQDYVDSIQDKAGDSRKTNLRVTDPYGNQKSGEVTVADINMNGGVATSKRDVSFSLQFNGKPTKTDKSAADALSSTVAGGSASGTTSFTATPDGSNTLAYRLTAATVGTVYGSSYVFETMTNYTSGSDIEATAGQFLSMYELDEYGRVAKFTEHELLAGDITA